MCYVILLQAGDFFTLSPRTGDHRIFTYLLTRYVPAWTCAHGWITQARCTV